MNKFSLIIFFIFLFGIKLGLSSNYDFLISTHNDKNAKIFVETTDFKNNTFTVNLDIVWVNNKLKPVKNNETVLAINIKDILILPGYSVLSTNSDPSSEYSNTNLSITFSALPDFEGGNIKVLIPLVYAEDVSKAQMGYWNDVLYAQAKNLEIELNIDKSQISDIYPPKIVVNSPLPQDDEDYFVTDAKFIDMTFSAMDRSGVDYVTIGGRYVRKNQQTGMYEHRVVLNTGFNEIQIVSIDSAGNEGTFVYEVVCSFQAEIQVDNGKYYALLIACQDYTDPFVDDLDNPIRDADSLKHALTNFYTFEEQNVTFLKNPSKSEIIAQFEHLANTLTPNDNLLIFYAGHGYWDEQKEIGYWLPADMDFTDFSTWLRNSTVKDYMGAIKTRHTLLITDACFSGSIFKTRAVAGAKFVAYQRIYDLKSRKGMTSGTLKTVPDESIFLKSLNRVLVDNDEKYFTASEVFNLIRPAVLNNSDNVPQYGTMQGVGDEGGEFIFIKRGN